MANISPSTTIGSLPSDMTIKELAKHMKRMGLSGFDDDDDFYDFDDYDNKKKNVYGEGPFGEVVGGISKVVSAIEKVGETIGKMDREIMNLLKPWRDVDNAASKYARTVGANVERMTKMRNQAISDVNRDRMGLKYGMNAADLINAQANYVKGIGRQVNLAGEDQQFLAAITRVYGDSTEMFNAFDKVGVSMEGVGKHMGKMYADAAKSGLSLAKYSDNVKQGLAMANKYSFSNGLKGMEAMAKRAAAIRMDMQQVEAFANSFNTLDTAISNSARLQVLGGQFAMGADPLGLLNDALTDMEGMQKRMEGFTAGMARFNRSTGEAKIDPHNIWKLNEYAKITGQDASKVQEVARRQAMRGEIEKDLRRSGNYASLSEEMRELIRNSATFKDGEFQVRVGRDYKKLSELSEKDRKELEKTTQDQREDIRDIAIHVRSLDEHREGFGKQWENVQAGMTKWLGTSVKWLTAIGTTTAFGGFMAMGAMGIGAIFKQVLAVLKLIAGGVGIGKVTRRLTRGSVSSSSSKITDFIGKFAKGGAKGAEGVKVVGSRGAEYTTYIRQDNGIGLRDSAGRPLSKARSTKILESQSKKAVSQASKKAVSQATKKGVTETAKKAAVKGVGKIGGKLAAGVVKGGGLGIVGAVGNIATDALVESGKMKEGGTGHMLAKTGSSALEGAAMASMVAPFFGPAAPLVVAMGALGGAVVGATKVQKLRNEKTLDTQLQSLGIERKGSYGAKRLSDIDKALQTGKMSDSLRKRLIREGDTDIVNQINAISEQKKREKEEARKEKEEKRDRMAERLGKIFGGGPKRIGTAHFIVTNGIFEGVKYGTGGRIGASSLLANPLAKISPVGAAIRGAREIGRKIKFRKGNEATYLAEELRRTKGNEPNSPIKVDISGTLNLKTPKGESIDIMGEIKRNPALLTELTQYVVKELNKQQNGGYKVDRIFGNNPIR